MDLPKQTLVRICVIQLITLPCILTLPVISGSSAASAQTRAGDLIINSARANGLRDDEDINIVSNEIKTVIDEVLDVSLVPVLPDTVQLSSGIGTQTVAVTVRNGGNGNESFTITAGSDSKDLALVTIAQDRDGDGRFDPTIDTVLDGGRTPLLEPGQSLRLFIRLDVKADSGSANLIVAAHAVTGSGSPGALFGARGDGDGNAVVGPTGAAAELRLPAILGGPGITLAKTQEIAAGGNGQPVSGAVVTYSLTLSVSVGAELANARITDPIPGGTSYVPNSLRLDGAALSDASDSDAGSIRNEGVEVALGNISKPAVRVVTFQAKLN